MTSPSAARFLRHCISRLAGEGDADARDAATPCSSIAGSSDDRRAVQEERMLGGVTLLPHQVAGARRLREILDAHGGALLADEVGLGKTFTALQVARRARRILIVAPAGLRPMWRDACLRSAVQAEITSYERLSARPNPTPGRWTLVVLDEAHHARSPATRRYRALCELTRGAEVLLLTATPIHNRRRDLQSLFALFLGAGADQLDEATLSALIVRRRVDELAYPLPHLRALVRHPVPPANGVLDALRELTPPLPPADGGVAHALVILQLTRAWCSSDAALLAAIRNRLATAAALEHALESGRLPARRDLVTWAAGADGSVQLAFPELVAAPVELQTSRASLGIVRAHAESLRRVRALVRGSAARDEARVAALTRALQRSDGRQAVVFTHSAETAESVFVALRGTLRVALLTGRGAFLASGPVSRDDILRQFAPGNTSRAAGEVSSSSDGRYRADAMRIDVLIATDVLSEGIDLQRAAVVIHLDLPWTPARMEQRIGRLRRLGSPHAAVEVHLIAPPVGAAELAVTLAHLTRKASLAASTMGRSSLLGDAADWSGILPGMATNAPATARGAMLAALRRLEALAAPSRRSSRPELDCDPHVRAPPGNVRWRLLRHAPERTLALVTLDGSPHLLSATPDAVTLDPSAVVAALENALRDAVENLPEKEVGDAVESVREEASENASEHAAEEAAEEAAEHATAHATEHAAETLVRKWCAARTAAQLLSAPAARNSRSHRRLLHAIDHLAIRAPRTRRAQVADAATAVRALVAGQRGAGSERRFDALLASSPVGGTDVEDDVHWLEEIRRALLDDAPERDSGVAVPTIGHGLILHGMLTLLSVGPAP